MQRFVIITGLSGSGKSLALDCLEDLGYFCVDNLPVPLIPPFFELIEGSAGRIERAALGIDIRGGEALQQVPEILAKFRASAAPVDLVFLECDDKTLSRRFSETRRPHPMAAQAPNLTDALRREREALQGIRDVADQIIDTTSFTVHQLRSFMKSSFDEPHGRDALNINILSFGHKYGLPTVADLAFDVRFLPNPYFEEDLRAKTGQDAPVREFLQDRPETGGFLQRLREMMDFLVPLYVAEGKSYLTVAIGCTGGKHRSVAVAEWLAEHLTRGGLSVSVSHRDLGRE